MAALGDLLPTLEQGRDLEAWEAENLMHFLIGGNADEEEILTILNAMCDKGPTEVEIVAFAKAMRSKALMLDHQIPHLVDTCGTGGGRPTFNISTAAAFVAAGAGARIAKHGNRSSTGLGSADLLESLGVRLGGTPESLIALLETVGIAFLFAPVHHPAMGYVAPARKKLGRRSVFNLLGPLVNPARAPRQLIGIYDPQMIDLMANSVKAMDLERAVLAHSQDGLDEISPCANTDIVVVTEGKLTRFSVRPEDFGSARLVFDEIKAGQSLEDAKSMFMAAISDPASSYATAVIPSAAVAIWLADLAPSFEAAAELARTAIASGAAAAKLALLIQKGGLN